MFRISFYLFLITILCCKTACSQNWPKIYGDEFHSLVKDLHETYDKGLLVTGFAYIPYGFCRFTWIIKTDINGNIIWDKKIGDWTHQFWLSGSEITNDNGLIYSGATTKYSGNFDPLFVKMNACGEIEWCSTMICSEDNYGMDVITLKDGNYIGMLQYYGEGESYARISLVKFDTIGEPLWIQQLAQEDSLITNEEGNYLYQSKSGNFLISGAAYHPDYLPYWILTDTNGTEIWDLFWNDINGESHQVHEMYNNFFYATSWALNENGVQTPMLFKFNESGNSIASYFLMGDTITAGSSSPIDLNADTTLVIGLTWRVGIPLDEGFSEIIITDTLGNLLNRRILVAEYHVPQRIFISSDNKILVTGYYFVDNNFDIYLWKMNANLEDDTLYTQPLTYDSLCPYEIQSDTVDLDCDLFVNIHELPTKEEYESTVKISPNPARNWVALTLPDVVAAGKVEVAVYDVYGREVGKGRKGEGENGRKGEVMVNRMVVMDVSSYTPGIYVVVVTDVKGRRFSGKMIVR